MADIFDKIFKQGSKTYYYSSIFFPKQIRDNVFILYGFVRKADNYVDQVPQDKKGFFSFNKKYFKALKGQTTGDAVISGFINLMKKRGFEAGWVKAFLNAMEMDTRKKIYRTLKETEKYMYGSAEVIGLFMSKIMGLSSRAYPAARLLGKSMQYINFIRDIAEDIQLGRQYLPLAELKKYKLPSLRFQDIKSRPRQFKQFIQAQIRFYLKWQELAAKGYRYIPKNFLIPIKTASDLYNWTAKKILKDPMIIYRKKVKPSFCRIIFFVIKNMFTA